jgi:hypothetical protein
METQTTAGDDAIAACAIAALSSRGLIDVSGSNDVAEAY